MTETRVQAGDTPQVELYRIRFQKLASQQAILQPESGYRQACLNVLNLLNSQRTEVVVQLAAPAVQEEPAGAALDLVGDFSDGTPLPTLDELKRIGLQERRDVEAARRTREAAHFGTRLADAQRKRDTSIETEYQRAVSIL